MTKAKAIFCLCAAIVAVSCSAILIRFSHTPPLAIAFYRQLFSGLLLLPFARNDQHAGLTGREKVYLVFSGFFLALHFSTWITSLSLTSVARATLFVDLQPIWASILGAILLSEKLNKLEVAGVAVVSIGGLLTVVPNWGSGFASLKGDFLATCGGLAGACYFLIGRKIRKSISWSRYMVSVYFISACWILLFHLVLTGTVPGISGRDAVWILAMALIPSLLGHGLFNFVIRHIKAYVVNAAFFGEPVLATLFAYLFFREAPDRFFYFGALLIFAGLAFIFSQQRSQET